MNGTHLDLAAAFQVQADLTKKVMGPISSDDADDLYRRATKELKAASGVDAHTDALIRLGAALVLLYEASLTA
jgi:hypothetical protein